jgi:hypothetical protein
MCWMPLYASKIGAVDKAWAQVQTVFKGKPAYSIEKEGSKAERPVLVFGVSELMHPDAKVNCEDCHYVHKSMSEKMKKLGDLWMEAVELTRRKEIKTLDSIDKKLKTLGFEKGVESFVDYCVKNGISDGVLEFTQIFDSPTAMSHFNSSGCRATMFNTFAGCRDCNLKMTAIKYVHQIYQKMVAASGRQPKGRAARPVSAGVAGRAKRPAIDPADNPKLNPGTDTEAAMQCFLFGGLLHANDRLYSVPYENHMAYYFEINDQERCDTWAFRFCVLWCLYQVLFCVWENRTIGWSFRHHVSYVYSGIQNFYLALLFYVLHCANGNRDTIDFETFNFFYASHLPFFLMKNDSSKTSRSLSAMLLDEDIDPKEEPDARAFEEYTAAKLRQEFGTLKTKVLGLWESHFKSLSLFIHGSDELYSNKEAYTAFFCDPRAATTMSRHSEHSGGESIPDVTTSSRVFNTGPGYWFHFKSITMAKIEMDSELYYASHDDPLIRQMWADWYRHLCFRIRQLDTAGVRLAAVASHFQLGDGPSMHLSALLRGGAGSRWRTRVV